jgi:hypothetical protein
MPAAELDVPKSIPKVPDITTPFTSKSASLVCRMTKGNASQGTLVRCD